MGSHDSFRRNDGRSIALPLSAPILVVEDDPDAVIVIRELISRAIAAPIDVAKNAVEAIAYLEDRVSGRARLLPRLVLVDSSLAGTDGGQVVNWIRKCPQLSGLMIMVMGGTPEPAETEKREVEAEIAEAAVIVDEKWSSDAEPAPLIRQAGYLSVARDLKGLAFA